MHFRNIFADSGVEWKNYRYYDPKTIGLDFQGMLEDLGQAPDGSVVVLHGKLPLSLHWRLEKNTTCAVLAASCFY